MEQLNSSIPFFPLHATCTLELSNLQGTCIEKGVMKPNRIRCYLNNEYKVVCPVAVLENNFA